MKLYQLSIFIVLSNGQKELCSSYRIWEKHWCERKRYDKTNRPTFPLDTTLTFDLSKFTKGKTHN